MDAYRDLTGEIEDFLAREGQITEDNYEGLSGVLEPDRIVDLVTQVIHDDTLLQTVASNSYIHSQGFSKIVLADGRSQGKFDYKLRNHIWPEQVLDRSAPLLEMRHEHRWNFVSRILKGSLEDHWYITRELKPKELAIYQKFETAMKTLSPVDIGIVCSGIEAMEVAGLGNNSILNQQVNNQSDLISATRQLLKRTGAKFSENELTILGNILVKFSNSREPGTQKEIYKHEGPKVFEPQAIHHHEEGSFRFHPVEIAHRLAIARNTYNATAIITGPTFNERKPGEFVRSVANKALDTDDVRSRQYYTPDTLRPEFEKLISLIR